MHNCCALVSQISMQMISMCLCHGYVTWCYVSCTVQSFWCLSDGVLRDRIVNNGVDRTGCIPPATARDSLLKQLTNSFRDSEVAFAIKGPVWLHLWSTRTRIPTTRDFAYFTLKSHDTSRWALNLAMICNQIIQL